MSNMFDIYIIKNTTKNVKHVLHIFYIQKNSANHMLVHTTFINDMKDNCRRFQTCDFQSHSQVLHFEALP